MRQGRFITSLFFHVQRERKVNVIQPFDNTAQNILYFLSSTQILSNVNVKRSKIKLQPFVLIPR